MNMYRYIKIKHNFYYKNINNQSNYYFFSKNIISHILKFLPKFNTTYDHFFLLIFNKIDRTCGDLHCVVILLTICDWFYFILFYFKFYSSLILKFQYFVFINLLGTMIKKFKWTYDINLSG